MHTTTTIQMNSSTLDCVFLMIYFAKKTNTLEFEFDFSKAISYVTWARFRYTTELQEDLIEKFKNLMHLSLDAQDIANSYNQIVKTIKELTFNKYSKEPFGGYYNW